MADIQKWCLGQMKEAQAALESALRQADEEGLRMELRQALEIYGRLEEELVQLKVLLRFTVPSSKAEARVIILNVEPGS